MADPTLEAPPDFASGAFRLIREALMATQNIDEEAATANLLAAWQTDHDHRVNEWNNQRRAQAEEEVRRANELREREEEAHWQAEEQAENERKEAEKKKPKMNNFVASLAPPNVIEERPFQYALNKIASFDIAPLWYFTPEGCRDAAKYARLDAGDAYGLTSTNDVLTLKLVASVKASKNARPDECLTFSEFLQARVSFLHHIKKAGWPETHVNALAMFFWNMESHPQRTNPNGDLIVLTYAATIRQQWHDQLKANTGDVFDISITNEALMNTIAFSVNGEVQRRLENRVSPSPLSSPNKILTKPITTPFHRTSVPL